jgi:hypothetical protein
MGNMDFYQPAKVVEVLEIDDFELGTLTVEVLERKTKVRIHNPSSSSKITTSTIKKINDDLYFRYKNRLWSLKNLPWRHIK